MSEPFTPDMIARHLRLLSDADLRVIHSRKFQMHPVRKIVPGAVIRELISNERARRA